MTTYWKVSLNFFNITTSKEKKKKYSLSYKSPHVLQNYPSRLFVHFAQNVQMLGIFQLIHITAFSLFWNYFFMYSNENKFYYRAMIFHAADLEDVREVLTCELWCISGMLATSTECVHLGARGFLQNTSIKWSFNSRLFQHPGVLYLHPVFHTPE